MKSLHKALDIIDTIAEHGQIGIREISTITGFPPATTHRTVSTLVKRRYLKRNPITKKYSLSLRFLELGTKVQQQFNLAAIAQPHLQRLMSQTKESANLAVRDGNEAVYLTQVRGNYMLQLFTNIGARVPLYATGVGKMFMSQLSKSDLENYFEHIPLKARTLHTLIIRDEIMQELAQIRIQGFAVDNEEMEEGVRCVAALVYDHNHQPVAAVSISGPSFRITPDRIENFGQTVRRCALSISRSLGFNSAIQDNEKEANDG